MIIKKIKFICLDSSKIEKTLKDWGIRYDSLFDGEYNVMKITAYNVSSQELLNLRTLVAADNAIKMTIIGADKGKEIIRDITEYAVIPAIRDAVSTGFNIKDFISDTYNDIKQNPRKKGDWTPLKNILKSIRKGRK